MTTSNHHCHSVAAGRSLGHKAHDLKQQGALLIGVGIELDVTLSCTLLPLRQAQHIADMILAFDMIVFGGEQRRRIHPASWTA